MGHEFKLLIIDVDGTLTDAGIYYDANGNEIKRFCTRDAAAFFVAKAVGIKIMVLTGRESKATAKRMQELGVDYLHQNVKDKKKFILDFSRENHIPLSSVVVIGDDLNDVAIMKMAGFVGGPADACEEVKTIADYVSKVKGGEGAVRDIVEYLLKKMGKWNEEVKKVYGIE